MQHPETWFTERIGKEILRGSTRITVTEKNAKNLHTMQDDLYFFSDVPGSTTPAQRRIHISDSSCISCEG